jgi:RNA polymerase sigma-70 factor (ECF subfamily)
MSETLLIDQCKAHNQKAQLALYKKYADGMYVVAHAYLRDEESAKDAVQEGFIKAFKSLEQYREEVSFGAWLKKIVINQCLDTLKKHSFERLDEEVAVLAVEEEEQWNIATSCTSKQIITAIDRLKEPYLSVLRLFLLEGYDHLEISEILGITHTASRTYLHRAKQKVKNALEQQSYGTRS